MPERLATVLATVYLIVNRGYGGRGDLTGEALWLGRALVQLRPEQVEPHGLLALMLLHDARRDARTGDGQLVLLADRDRSLWNAAQHTKREHPSGVPSRSGPWTLSATRGRHGKWLIDEQGHGDVSKDEAIIMQSIKDAAADFLSHKRVAVTGVSRNAGPHGSNAVYQRLRQRGYEVFPVNPNAEQVEGTTAYPNLKSIPGGVETVVIGTRPEHAQATVEECAELGIKQVWMHRGPGGGSVSGDATEWGRAHGMTVIDGGCPLMFEPTSDPGHKVMRWMFSLGGNVPRKV